MFPLSKDHWHALSPFLEQGMEMDRDERRVWLERVRETHPTLADDVQALLDEHEELEREGSGRPEKAAAFKPAAR